MNAFRLSPALGWAVGGALALALLALAIVEVVLFVQRHGSSDETIVACVRRTVILVLASIMMLTPSIVSSTTSRAVNATDVIMAVDVTGSMAVEDAQYGSSEQITRLEAAQQAVHDITSTYADASFAAIRFGASASLDVPLTPDSLAIENWADTLRVETTSVSSGSTLDTPIDQLLLTAKEVQDQHPNDAIVLYIITDGEQTAEKARRTYSSLRRYVDDGFVLGVGSTAGGNIPVISSDGTSTGKWITDPDTGKAGVSKLNETALTNIADEISGTYVTLNATTSVKDAISSKTSDEWRTTETAKERTRVTPIVWPFAIALSALLAWEIGAWIATSRRLL